MEIQKSLLRDLITTQIQFQLHQTSHSCAGRCHYIQEKQHACMGVRGQQVQMLTKTDPYFYLFQTITPPPPACARPQNGLKGVCFLSFLPAFTNVHQFDGKSNVVESWVVQCRKHPQCKLAPLLSVHIRQHSCCYHPPI